MNVFAIAMPDQEREHETQLADSDSPANSGDAARKGSTFSKALEIFDLFSLQRTDIHVDDIVSMLGMGQSTGYRYLRELCDAGFLVHNGKGRYSLGPRIVELDRLLQLSDPLLLAGKKIMQMLANACANRAVLLCTLYKDRVACIHKVGADAIRSGKIEMPILRGRGTPLPLFSGAGSHAILAYLPSPRLKSLYVTHQNEIRDARLGESWAEFRDTLSKIRKQGFAMTLGQINANMAAIAVPVFRDGAQVIGSLLALGENSAAEREALREFAPVLHDVSAEIERQTRTGSNTAVRMSQETLGADGQQR